MSQKPKLLIVDDQLDNLKVISQVLGKEFQLSLADSGEKAFKVMEKFKPDLVLLDIMMPVMDGFEFIKELKTISEYSDIPVIFLSAKDSIEDITKGFELGAVDYIKKPINPNEVRVRVNTHVTNHLSQKKIFEQKEELAKTNAEKDRFFSIIAHDLKNPFAGLIGSLKVLLEEGENLESEDRQEYVKELLESSENVYDLLENLLEWTRLQRGNLTLNRDPFQLSMLSWNIVSILNAQASIKNIKLVNEVEDGFEVNADPMMISTIIRNLMSNSIKFTPEKGEVSVGAVETKGSPDFITVYVRDNGVGIPKNKVDKLFKIDEAVSSEGTNNEKGTGLGLILCKEFAELNGGKIWVESEEGKGTTFFFTVPRLD